MLTKELAGVELTVAVLAAYGVWQTTTQIGRPPKTVSRYHLCDSAGVIAHLKTATSVFDMHKGVYITLDHETVGLLCDEFNISTERPMLFSDQGAYFHDYWFASIGGAYRMRDANRLVAACRTLVSFKLGEEVDINKYVKEMS